MIQKLGSLFLIISVVTLIALTGCERVQDVVMDSMPPEDITMEVTPVKLVWLIDYPEGGKDAYIAWVASIAATLQAPDEITRIRSYDNQDQTLSPNRLVEFEFNSFLDAAAYLNRPEIAEILGDLPNHTTDVTMHTFIQRSDYAITEKGNYPIKGVYFIDYPLGGKQEYLEWVDSISPVLVGPPQVKLITSYDNYYGESPHRLVEFEFASQEDATAYDELEDIMALEPELDVRTSSWTRHTFELRSDYINE